MNRFVRSQLRNRGATALAAGTATLALFSALMLLFASVEAPLGDLGNGTLSPGCAPVQAAANCIAAAGSQPLGESPFDAL
jgi:hypothetical protein